MRRVILILVLLPLLMGATIRVGTDRAAPGVMKECVNLINDIADLGSEPTGAQLSTGVNNLRAGTASALQWELTPVENVSNALHELPTDFCTDTVPTMTWAGAFCAKKSLKPNNVQINNNAATFVCVDPMDVTDAKFWVRVNCP